MTKTTWTSAAGSCRELGFMLRRTGNGSERALYKIGTPRPLEDGATYFTDDAQDAMDTAAFILRREEEASALAWAASRGAPERGNMEPISPRNRALIRFWMARAHKISTANIVTLTAAQLSEIWHDTTNAKLNAIKQKGA